MPDILHSGAKKELELIGDDIMEEMFRCWLLL
jgi:hypothetical protein